VPLRGNLDTRIKKIKTRNLDGIIVAAAGIHRMGWIHKASEFIPLETMLPSVGQGVLGIELRKDGNKIKENIAFINHKKTWFETTAERAFLKHLGGGCQFPIAAYARIHDDVLTLKGLLGSLDGRIMLREEVQGHYEEADAIGTLLAENILSGGGKEILQTVYQNGSSNQA
jgi:hydroxymethylbilane synthase